MQNNSNQYAKEQIIYSKPEAWGSGKKLQFDMDFLMQAQGFDFPEIVSLDVHLEGSVTTGVGGPWIPEDHCRVYENFLLKERGGKERCDFDATTWRGYLQHELGYLAYPDPVQQLANVTNADYEIRTPLWPELKRAAKSSEFYLVLERFIGGLCHVKCGPTIPAVNVTINSGNVRLEAKIREGKKADSKVRVAYLQDDLPDGLSQHKIELNGWTRAALVLRPNDVGTAGYQVISGVDSLTSSELDYEDVNRLSLVEQYLRRGHTTTADVVAEAKAFPIVSDVHRANNKLRYFGRPTVKFDAAFPNGSKVIRSVILNRDPQHEAEVHGFQTVAAFKSAAFTRGYLKGADGRNHPVASWPKGMMGLMGLRIPEVG